MIELELTYLAKYLPENLKESENKKITDLYIENGTGHCDLRARQNRNKFEITRKRPVDPKDISKQMETTIELNETEFKSLSTSNCKKVAKTRFFYDYNGMTAEFDVFAEELLGLVMVDFEFKSEAEKDSFVMPDFCLADVTQEDFIAGGILAGKKYADIENKLNQLGYKKM